MGVNFEDPIYMALALEQARAFEGATAPNPPVGACVVRDGAVIAVGAHERAGSTHAEVVALKRASEAMGRDGLRGATLYVTLEPCNHQGRTPPCTGAILEAGISRVVIGCADPNPRVAGGGTRALREVGIEVFEGVLRQECEHLIAPFRKWALRGKPWIVHKLAFQENGSMIPRAGQTTFTSEASLREAHLERRRCDAIITTVATIEADLPRFNVRHIQDHAGKKRWLIVVSRGGRVAPADWIQRQQQHGFDVQTVKSLDEALALLGEKGAHRVLIEAGPRFSREVDRLRLWDERLVFVQRPGREDLMFREQACSRE